MKKEVDINTFGGRVRDLRKRSGFKLKTFSAVSGISVSMLSQIERGAGDPSLKTMRKIATALKCSVGFLVDGPARPSNNEPIELAPVDANGAPVDE